jgi:Skp family chaperone for outer membrane proteins
MVRLAMITFLIGAMLSMFAQPTPVTGKTTSADVLEQVDEAWQAFRSYMVQQKNEAVAEGKKLLKKADAKIQKMEGKPAKASGDAKAEYDASIKKLKERRAEAAKKLGDLGNASSNAWDSAKDGFAKAYKDLCDAYDEAAGKFSAGERGKNKTRTK